MGVMLVVAVVLGVVVSGLAIPFAGVLGFAARNTADGMDNLPQELETGALAQRTTILDTDGNVIASVYDENRINVSLNQVNRTMVKALLSIEDYRFYEHGALDVKGTLRALFTNAAASGVVQGGSTITQQLVKLTLLGQANGKKERAAVTDDTYARKLRELRYAIALENVHTKDWILERYLNTAYFGDGAYGVQAAAKHYFNVDAKKLNLNQSAILAGLVQSPGAFDPTVYPERTIERRDVVLDRMAQLSVIGQKRADKTKSMGLRLRIQPVSNGCFESEAPFFCSYAMAYLMQDKRLGANAKERKRLIYSGGLTIHTTVDLRFQKAADASVQSHVYKENRAIGALAMVQPLTGEVKAIAQSRPMGLDKDKGYTFLNYVVPRKYGKANGFQPGSTFKAFVLAAAINQHIPLNRQIVAPAQISLPENSFRTCDGFYQSSQTWDPRNFDGKTATYDLYSGTRNSVNTFFAQLEQRTGICEPYQLARSMGVQLTDRSHEMVPSFTLGVADVSPLEMAEAYATFAGRGVHCDSRPITSIDDANGNEIRTYPAACSRVMPEKTADAVNDVLRGVQENGGFGDNAGIALDDRDDAGKTGTTTGSLSVWFVGYTPELATAAVVAGADVNGNQITLDGQTLGPSTVYSAAGSTTAGPIWGDAMKAVAQYLPKTQFVAPDPQDIVGVQRTVPVTTGMSVAEATNLIRKAGFGTSTGGPVRSSYPYGTVAYTSPGGGTDSNSGETVVIYTSSGKPPKPPKPPRNGGGGRGGR
ncbi:transglycosylase domain-containing protein [soil metagenome]